MADNNSITLSSEGYVEITLVGDQTEDTFRRIYETVEPLREKLLAKNMPVLCLFDLSRQTGFSLQSDKEAMELLESTQYDKIAMFAVPHAEVTKGIILATGKSDITKIFDAREEALVWLLSK